MNNEERDDLWQLLGRAKETAVSPFFSRNVLRSIREEESRAGGIVAWLWARWRFAVIGAVVFAVFAGVLVDRMEQPDPLVVIADQVSGGPDYQVINHLDELLDSERNSVWLEASAY